ncbi:hypothetical protein Tco_0250342 [Tanacetum coccineum]
MTHKSPQGDLSDEDSMEDDELLPAQATPVHLLYLLRYPPGGTFAPFTLFPIIESAFDNEIDNRLDHLEEIPLERVEFVKQELEASRGREIRLRARVRDLEDHFGPLGER